MSVVLAQPEALAAAVADLSDIGSAIRAATAAGLGRSRRKWWG
nr:PE domain-containing protein [Mycobacterium riyadhense]